MPPENPTEKVATQHLILRSQIELINFSFTIVSFILIMHNKARLNLLTKDLVALFLSYDPTPKTFTFYVIKLPIRISENPYLNLRWKL